MKIKLEHSVISKDPSAKNKALGSILLAKNTKYMYIYSRPGETSSISIVNSDSSYKTYVFHKAKKGETRLLKELCVHK
jgi:hypothetical protein